MRVAYAWRSSRRMVTAALAVFFACAGPAAARIPNDSDYGKQWYHETIEAPLAWESTVGSRQVVVAVIDAGFFLDHPDLAPNLWRNEREVIDDVDNDGNGFVDDIFGWDFLRQAGAPAARPEDPHTIDGLNHGTIVAGIIAGRGGNRQGIAGLAWRVLIMPLRALDGFGDGEAETVAMAVDYAVTMGADIINLSLVGDRESALLTAALRRAWDAGVVIVAAAGNQYRFGARGRNLAVSPAYPVCSDRDDAENWIIGVAATARDDTKAWFSNYGRGCVDISAPGDGIWSTQKKGEPPEWWGGSWRGSSVAAPFVSGAAALLKSANPSLTNREIRDILMKGADPIDEKNPMFANALGAGRLNVGRAMALVPGRRAKAGTVVVSVATGGVERIFAINRFGAFVEPPERARLVFDDETVGDLDGDGAVETLVAPARGSSEIIVYNRYGTRLPSLVLPGSPAGYKLAVGDLDGDDVSEIVTLTSGRAPVIRIYDGAGALRASSDLLRIPRGARVRLTIIGT